MSQYRSALQMVRYRGTGAVLLLRSEYRSTGECGSTEYRRSTGQYRVPEVTDNPREVPERGSAECPPARFGVDRGVCQTPRARARGGGRRKVPPHRPELVHGSSGCAANRPGIAGQSPTMRSPLHGALHTGPRSAKKFDSTTNRRRPQ